MASSAALLSSSSLPFSSPLFHTRSPFHFGSPAAISPLPIKGIVPTEMHERIFLAATNFLDAYLLKYVSKKRVDKMVRKASTVTAPAAEEVQECKRPSWADFELGKEPVYWRTMNGLPPSSGEKLILFYNPKNKLVPHDEFGIGFNGGFNQPIMCGGEPREMTRKIRGEAEPPLFTIKICVPKHAVNLIFSFTNGVDWDGPYKLQFQVPKWWQNRPISFFNERLAEEMSKDGACEKAIFPEANIIIARCAMIGNLTAAGGDRCNLNLVPGCTDPSSPDFNPLANVDDGSCPIDSDSED